MPLAAAVYEAQVQGRRVVAEVRAYEWLARVGRARNADLHVAGLLQQLLLLLIHRGRSQLSLQQLLLLLPGGPNKMNRQPRGRLAWRQ